MENPSSHEDGGMAIPINSTYGGGHAHAHAQHMMMPHNHIAPSSNGATIDHHVPYNNPTMMVPKKMVRYRECLKNHAASMGGNATDGCGEFMPSGEEGSLEALTCSACNCHRNFHRKEVEGETPHTSCDFNYHTPGPHFKPKAFVGHHYKALLGSGPDIRGYPRAPHHMISSYNNMVSESDEQEEGGGRGVVVLPPHHQVVKKRFRTKFTQEQKEKMMDFAERVGWKLQKTDESVVQQFCQQVGVKRRVLKVWMHNNKHSLSKKSNNPNPHIQVQE